MAASTHPRPHIRAILTDISGTLHVGSTPTPNAVEALHRLRSSRIPFRLCSNTSKESTTSLIDRLNKMGFGIPPQANSANTIGAGGLNTRSPREVWTSIVAAVSQVLSNLGLKRPFTILSKSAWEEVASAIQVPEDNRPNQSSNSDSFSASQPSASRCSHNNLLNVATTNDDQREFDSVIVGLAPSALNYDNLNTAFRILIGEHPLKDHRRPGSSAFSHPTSVSASGDPNLTTSITAPAAKASPDTGAAKPTRGGPELDYPLGRTPAVSIAPTPCLIATHKAKYSESDSPPGLSLGPGPFVSALEIAAGVEAHVVGKPTRAFFEAVLGDFTAAELRGEDNYGGLINDRRSRTTPATVASRNSHEETEDSMGEAQGEDGYPRRSAARSTAATIVLTTNASAARGNSAGKETWGDRGRIAVIGDDVEADLGEGAIELGLWRVLVRTGKYRPGDESRQGIIPPDEVVDTFAEFVDSLLESNLDYENGKGMVASSGGDGNRN